MYSLDVALWLVAAIVPGGALIRLLWPEAGWLRTVACAPAVSCGFCYIIGLGSSRLSLSPVPAVLTAAVGLVLGVVVAEFYGWRRTGTRRRQMDGPAPDDERMKVAANAGPPELMSWFLLAGGVALGVWLWSSFQSTMNVPVGWDAMHHGYFIEQISRFHTMRSSVVLSSDTGGTDGTGAFYPLAYNLIAAMLHGASGSPISTVMLASTIALAGVLLPVGVFALVHELDPRRPLVAGFSAIAAVLPMLMYLIEGTGRLTAIFGIVLVPGLVIMLMSQHARMRWSTLTLASLGIAGIAGVHTSEAPLAIFVAAVCVMTRSGGGGDRKAAWRWLGRVVAAALVAVIVLIILEPDVLQLVSERGGAIAPPVRRPGGQVLNAALVAVSQAWLLPLLGCVVTVLPRWRHFRGPAGSLVLFMVFYYLVGIGTRSVVPTLATAWYGAPNRISWDLTLLGAIPTAVGLTALTGWLGSAVATLVRYSAGLGRVEMDPGRAQRVERWAAVGSSAVAGGLILVAFAVPPVAREGRLVGQVAGPVNEDSRLAFQYLKAHVGAHEHVLDDLRTDGAMWMYVDDGVAPLFGNAPFLGAAPRSWLEKLWLSRNLMHIDSDPCVRTLLGRYAIRYIYVGDTRIFDGWAHFQSSRMTQDPAFSVAFHQGRAWVFVLNPASASAACDRDVTSGVRWG